MSAPGSPLADAPLPSPDGLQLRPFRALRYAGGTAEQLARRLCPPYDVIGDAERRRLELSDPHNAVHLILPRGEAPNPPNGSGRSPYEHAASLWRQWQDSGVLIADPAPAIYVYEIAAPTGTMRGLVGTVALAEPDAGIILPHEDTMPGPVADRLALTEATEANLEPIFLLYDGTDATAQILQSVDDREPLAVATTGDQTHRLWSVGDPGTIEAVSAALHPLRALIADGHHRYATYLQHRRDQHAAGRGAGPWDLGLAFLVDARRFGPHVEAIHRVLPDLPLEAAVRGARTGFGLSRTEGPLARALHEVAGAPRPAFTITDGRDWYLLTGPDRQALQAAVPAEHSAAWQGLDVTVAHHLLIRRLWGVAEDAGTVEYEHDARAAVQRAADVGGTCLLLAPTPVEAVARVAAAGDRMPRKSTLFLPKPATGMFFRPFTAS